MKIGKNMRINKWELLAYIALFFVGIAISFSNSSLIHPGLLDAETLSWNAWFQADLVRVYENMTERWSDHYRTRVHPIFTLATNPVVHILSIMGVAKPIAVRVLVSFASGLQISLAFHLFRLIGLRAVDAAVFSLLLAFSAASLFWTAVPETYIFGSVTVLLPLIVITTPIDALLD